ncbi:unnamed protein product [Rhizoctonia solani]|uniref:Uncharacterized protein n=1 Tax=Rhizoctonia solani TaxID=456999 RepID=A0A8H3H4C7_9AGAM|nr:unnamed protein product [Rhizoctonia solani]
MASQAGLLYPSVMIDVAKLVSTIVLTAEALAATAEALAEAAKAIMVLSQDFGGSQASEVHYFEHSNNRAEDKPGASQDQIDEHIHLNPQEEARVQKGLDSCTDPRFDLSNGGAPSQPHEQSRICHTPPEGETNNKLDAFPLSLKLDQSSEINESNPGSGLHPADEKNNPHTHHKVPEADFGILVHDNKSPSQRHLIRFNQRSGGASFMAYMALQNIKTVCIISNQKSKMDQYAKALQDITQFRVFHPTTSHCVRLADPTVQSFVTYTSPAILLLTPDQPLEIHHIGLHIDCLVYWGMPPGTLCYLTRFLARLPLGLSSCLVLTPGLGVDPEADGVVEYSAETLKKILEPGSLFNRVCETAGPILTRLGFGWTTPTLYVPPVRKGPTTSSATQNSPPQRPPLAPISRRNFQIMPPGHYYIILPTMQNSDITPLIAYIALNSLKIMCYLPDDKIAEVYNDINKIAAVNTFIGTVNIQHGVNQLRYSPYGVLLRSTRGNLGEHFTNDLASCLIHFGPPASPNFYVRTLAPKVTHSYLVLTDAERAILPQLSMTPSLREHPFLRDLGDPIVGSVMNDLRIRLSSSLAGQ